MTMRVYAHIFEADREKVAANVDRAVNEVHEMCIEPSAAGVDVQARVKDYASDQRFYLQSGIQEEFRTSDYEFGALTN